MRNADPLSGRPDRPAAAWKSWLILTVALAAISGAMLLPPVAQDLRYHLFADQEAWLGIPNFWNVASNIPFLAVGLAGWLRRPLSASALLGPGYALFCGFVLLIGIGSAYYHLAPTTQTLVWDRLPMSAAFMALFACLLVDAVTPRAAPLLIPLVLAGLLSVGHWYWTETLGRGDLRPYALVQFLPMLLFPIILLLFGTGQLRAGWLWMMLACYALAKAAEHYDASIQTQLGALSGHSVKHVLAAAASGCAVLSFPVARRQWQRQ